MLPSSALAAVGVGVVMLRPEGDDLVVVGATAAFVASLPEALRRAITPGARVHEILPPATAEAVGRLVEAAGHDPAGARTLERVEVPGEPAHWYRWTAVADEAAGGVALLSVDVTEAIRLRERTAVQDAERAAITDGLRDAVVLMTADRTIRYANAAAEAMLGDMLVGANWTKLRERIGFRRLDGQTRPITVERALAGFDPDPVDVRFVVGGAETLCRATVQPLRLEGEVIGAAVVLSDITEERRLALERKSLLARELAVNEQVRSEVAAALHDGVLQTLAELSVVVGATEATGGRLDPAAVLAAVDRGVEQCRRITEDLRPARIDEGVSAALEGLAEVWRGRGLLDVTTEGDQLPRLEPWRETLLYQVAAEALRNALKHARGSRVRLRQEHRDAEVVVVIADDGPGASAQARQAAADSGHLGLVLSRERMEAAGGTYAFNSPPGGGTVVTLTLPIG